MKRCADCGHVEVDHDDGVMGAREGDDWLCHTASHSCYQDRHLPGPDEWPALKEFLSEAVERSLRDGEPTGSPDTRESLTALIHRYGG